MKEELKNLTEEEYQQKVKETNAALQKAIDEIKALHDPMNNITLFRGYEFRCTSFACPEQYDVFKDSQYVAYVRKRWGNLSVHPIKNHEIDWDAYLLEEQEADEWNGSIDDRDETFGRIVDAIEKYYAV